MEFLYEQPQTSEQEYLLGKAVEVKPEESDIKKVPPRTRHPRPPGRVSPSA